MAAFRARAVLPVVLLAVALTGGCDSTFTPFVDQPSHFVLGGYLDASADTQFVRLNSLRRTVEIDEHLRAEVQTIHQGSGRISTWRDSIVQLDDGTRGRLFYSVFLPAPGHTYRLVATAPGVATAEATVRVPPLPTFVPGAAFVGGGGGRPSAAQIVLWRGLHHPMEEAAVVYDVEIRESNLQRRIRIRYTDQGIGTGEGRRYDIDLERDLRTVRDVLGRSPDEPRLLLVGMAMQLVVRSEEAATEVVGGRGSFGAVIRPAASWLPPDDVLEAAGFATPANSGSTTSDLLPFHS